jgi:hypothetical protein
VYLEVHGIRFTNPAWQKYLENHPIPNIGKFPRNNVREDTSMIKGIDFLVAPQMPPLPTLGSLPIPSFQRNVWNLQGFQSALDQPGAPIPKEINVGFQRAIDGQANYTLESVGVSEQQLEGVSDEDRKEIKRLLIADSQSQW